MNRLMRRLRKVPAALANLGLRGTLDYLRVRLRGPAARGTGLIRTRHCTHALHVRPGTSDLQVFRQIFAHREYRCLDDIPVDQVGLIVDCGANVGYASAYLLSRFPNSHVIAVEPDARNYAAMERNLAPFAGRWEGIRAGVWSESVGLVFEESTLGAGSEWGRRVRPARQGEPADMDTVSVREVLDRSHADRISILKIDIEGSEADVFRQRPEWLGRVDNIVIELHGHYCEAAFDAAVAGEGYLRSRCDELTVCKRPPAHASAPPPPTTPLPARLRPGTP